MAELFAFGLPAFIAIAGIGVTVVAWWIGVRQPSVRPPSDDRKP